MPFVAGFLRARRRPGRPGRPDQGLPGIEGPVDPDYGIEEGGGIWPGEPDIDPPEPPPGLWPPLTPEHPWRPVDPGWGQSRPLPPTPGQPLPRPPGGGGQPGQPLPGEPPQPGQPLPPGGGGGEPPTVGGGPALPGTIWPPLPPGVTGHYWALVAIGGMPGGVQYRYVVVDAGLRPGHPLPRPPGSGNRPDQGLPPTAEPRR